MEIASTPGTKSGDSEQCGAIAVIYESPHNFDTYPDSFRGLTKHGHTLVIEHQTS